MDYKFVAAVEDQDDCLQEPAVSVETESELTRRTALIQILNPHCPRRCLDRILAENAVPQC